MHRQSFFGKFTFQNANIFPNQQKICRTIRIIFAFKSLSNPSQISDDISPFDVFARMKSEEKKKESSRKAALLISLVQLYRHPEKSRDGRTRKIRRKSPKLTRRKFVIRRTNEKRKKKRSLTFSQIFVFFRYIPKMRI